MIPPCWAVAFLIPTLVSCMPSALLTTRSSQTDPNAEEEDSNSNAVGVRNILPQDKVEQAVLNHVQHIGSGAVNRPPLEGHVLSGDPPGVSTAQSVNQPDSVDQMSPVIPSDDFMCYNDKTSVVIPDVPCPAEDSLKVAVTVQLLNLVMKFQVGDIVMPGVSSVSPAYLNGYNLSDIGAADWMNYNKSDLSVRLQTLLQQCQENNTQVLDHLFHYISSKSISNITTLTHWLLDVMNSTSYFNICATNSSAHSTNNELSCDQLQAGIATLNYLNFQVQQLLASEDNSTNTSVHININATGIAQNGSLGSEANLDVIINDLIQRLRGTNADSKVLAELYKNLLLTLNNFKAVVVKLMKKFVTVLLESDFFEISDKLSSIMFDIQVALGGDVGIEKLDAQVSQTPNTEYTTETPTAGSIAENLISLGLTTRNVLSEATLQLLSSWEIKMQEVRQGHYLFNHSVLLKLEQRDTNVTNATLDAVKYSEEILEAAVTLISSLTELSQLLNKGKIPEYEEDEVFENLTVWHSLRSRTKRDVAGYMISSDRCQRQGNIINQTNFISLCSSCLHTTVLDNTYYPRYLTEKICSVGSSSIPAFRDGCLFQPGLFGGRPGGQCRQQQFHVILLRQVPGKCMKVISQGQEIITDQWQSTTHPLRIGCECVVDQNSQFAKYTHFP